MDIAQAYVQILPSTDGIGSSLTAALTSAGDSAAGAAGQSAGSKFSAVLGTAAKVGTAAIGAATTAVMAFGKSSVDAGMSFDSSMSQVAATMGYSVQELNTEGSAAQETFTKLRDFAQQMGSTTAFSATQAADALNYMALAGYDADTSMEMLPNVLNLAAAGGMDLATASDMVTDASSALGLSMDETREMVDKMAATSSKSNTSVSQLGEAILTVGGTAKNMAGGTTELSAALGILADNGIKGSEGGTALRNIILSLSTPTDKAKEALERFGGAEKLVYDEAGNMRPMNDIFTDLNSILGDMDMKGRTELLSTMFNKVDLKSVNALLAGTAAGTAEIDDALENSGVAWEKYADKVWATDDVFSGLIADLAYNLGEVGTSAEDLQEYLQFEYDIDAEDAMKIIEAASGAIDDQTNRWDELSGHIDNATGAAQNMADVQLDNLAGDMTLFESALEGAKIAVSDVLAPTLRDFVQTASTGLSDVTTAFKEEGLTGAMTAFSEWLSDAIGMIIDKVPSIIGAGTQLLMALIKGLVDNLPKIAEAGIEVITSLSTGIGNALPQLIPAAVGAVLTIATSLIDNIDQIISAALQLIIGLAEGMITALPTLIERIPQIITAIVGALVESIPKIAEAGLKLLSALVQNLPGIIAAVIKVIPEIITSITSKFGEYISTLVNTGKDLLAGVGQGIKEKAIDVYNAIKDFANTLISKVKGFFGIASPSTVFKDIGVNLISGLLNGVRELWGSVTEFFSNAASAVVGIFQGIPEKFKAFGSGIVNSLQAGAGEMWSGVTDFFSKARDGITGIFSKTPDALKTIGGNIVNGLGAGASGAMGRLNESLKGIVTGITNFMNDLNKGYESMKTVGGNLMTGLANGITEAASRAWEAAKSAASALVNGVKGIFGVASPSRVFEAIGINLDEGLAKGIVRKADVVDDAMTDLSRGLAVDAKLSMSTGFSAPASGLRSGTEASDMQTLINLLTVYLPQLANMVVTLNGNIVGQMAPGMDQELGLRAYYQNREVVAR